ncbi:MAG: hypothetical protein WEC34_15670 [Acidimicrobiia bacterium]
MELQLVSGDQPIADARGLVLAILVLVPELRCIEPEVRDPAPGPEPDLEQLLDPEQFVRAARASGIPGLRRLDY